MKSRDTMSETGIWDPEFLEWEAGLVGELVPSETMSKMFSERLGAPVTWIRHRPGPTHPTRSPGNTVQSFIDVKDEDQSPVILGENTRIIGAMEARFGVC